MSNHQFTATLLRTNAEGFAGLAAARLIEGHLSIAGPAGIDAWRACLRSQLNTLAAAVEDEAPELFAASVAWSRDAFSAREVSADAVGIALAYLSEVLHESLPGPAWAPLPMYFQSAREELARRATPPASELPGTGAHGQLALDYICALAAGDEPKAVALVLGAVDAGRLSVRDALEAVLVPAQREIGRLWHRGEQGVADEHFATHVTHKVLARVLAHAPAAPSNGRTVVVTSVAGDAHDMGVRVVAAFFELEGWRSICLGADTPIEELVQLVARFDADLVALGATLDAQRMATARAIEALRAARPGQRVLVGGAAFAGRADLWRRVGADAYASSPSEAVRTGGELVGG